MASNPNQDTARSPISEGINCYKASKVIKEIVSDALRTECKNEKAYYPKFSLPKKPLEEVEFSDLADFLVTPKRIKRECHGGSYYFKGFLADWEPIYDDGKKVNKVYLHIVGVASEQLDQQYQYTQACINGQLAPVEVSDNGQIVFHMSMKKELEKQRLNVFFPTAKCQYALKLKNLRNENVGHTLKAAVTDEELEVIFSTARDAKKYFIGVSSIDQRLDELEVLKAPDQPSSNAVFEESFFAAIDDRELSTLSGSRDLLDVLEAISDIAYWQDLGLKLDLKKSQLEIIDLNCRGDVKKCRMEMISLWMDRGNASWCALVRALASPPEEERCINLAKKIAAEHKS